MTRTMISSEAGQRLEEILEEIVRTGEPVQIVREGKVVAEIGRPSMPLKTESIPGNGHADSKGEPTSEEEIERFLDDLDARRQPGYRSTPEADELYQRLKDHWPFNVVIQSADSGIEDEDIDEMLAVIYADRCRANGCGEPCYPMPEGRGNRN